ncbi:predicted protein [Plenodomus lingam JN3]|uniref:Predicted protein n=1 Tax=Leptosphaeria maculans (strain JN3 / isolate v23.1.3 / race Av1-4-5-6-7-8) TaxID=985895 RepID=E4ZH57_LEPMJ|nr:predicted protein [Plenodomus lingam JN3]CBX90627.1 predicted protein [Plenodomus lingam JN3]
MQLTGYDSMAFLRIDVQSPYPVSLCYCQPCARLADSEAEILICIGRIICDFYIAVRISIEAEPGILLNAGA